MRVIREEYDDDYDDQVHICVFCRFTDRSPFKTYYCRMEWFASCLQFDDTVPVNVSKNDGSTFSDTVEDRRGEPAQQAAAAVGLSKREARKAGIQPASGPKLPAINWDVKMRDMKRCVSHRIIYF